MILANIFKQKRKRTLVTFKSMIEAFTGLASMIKYKILSIQLNLLKNGSVRNLDFVKSSIRYKRTQTRKRNFRKSGTWTFRKSGPYTKIHCIS